MKSTRKATDAEAVAKELGFDPTVHFVQIVRGKVGYSAGKPDEVLELAKRAIDAGYGITPELRRTVEQITYGRFGRQ